jgi:hypothetical protein
MKCSQKSRNVCLKGLLGDPSGGQKHHFMALLPPDTPQAVLSAYISAVIDLQLFYGEHK